MGVADSNMVVEHDSRRKPFGLRDPARTRAPGIATWSRWHARESLPRHTGRPQRLPVARSTDQTIQRATSLVTQKDASRRAQISGERCRRPSRAVLLAVRASVGGRLWLTGAGSPMSGELQQYGAWIRRPGPPLPGCWSAGVSPALSPTRLLGVAAGPAERRCSPTGLCCDSARRSSCSLRPRT
jgi:hypothetical protein